MSEELDDLALRKQLLRAQSAVQRVRLRLEYDLSTNIDAQPEFRGLKQLRLWLEGTY